MKKKTEEDCTMEAKAEPTMQMPCLALHFHLKWGQEEVNWSTLEQVRHPAVYPRKEDS